VLFRSGEDSPFIPVDEENTLYFFFTPNVSVPAERQLFDGATGIYVTHMINGNWTIPTRVVLQDKDKLSMDGCEFVQNNTIWFCSVREGYTGINWFTAEYENNEWTNWTIADFNPSYEVGELHFSRDMNTLYYHSSRPGGLGGLDIWMISRNPDGSWSEPENVRAVNSERNEGWPALSPDGNELWISKDYGLWRSILVNKTWSTPELIISTLAGEAAIDSDGNVYFVHHYYKDDVMLEGDIYVARKK
jgi:hypothetical protein